MALFFSASRSISASMPPALKSRENWLRNDLGSPQAEHVEVVDLPGIAGLLEPVVELDRFALANHVSADDNFAGVATGAQWAAT